MKTNQPEIIWEYDPFHYRLDQVNHIENLLKLNNGSIAAVFDIVGNQWTPQESGSVIRLIEDIKEGRRSMRVCEQ